MRQIVEKLGTLEREISSEKGDFSFFGLFLREDAQDRWDLLASASWIAADKNKALKYLVEQLSSRLAPEELLRFSRVVLLDEGSPILKAIGSVFRAKHARIELQETSLSGLRFEHAYIITSEGRGSAAQEGQGTSLSDFYDDLTAHAVNVRVSYEGQ